MRRAIATNPVDAAWLLASVLTVISWAVAGATSHTTSGTAEVVAVMVLGGVKTALVLGEFMEARHGPVWLRRFATVWVIGLWATLLVVFLA